MSVAVWRDLCAVAPSPELRERLRYELRQMREDTDSPILRQLTLPRRPRWPGFGDGTIRPPSEFPPGTSSREISRAAAERAPLRGKVAGPFRLPQNLAWYANNNFGIGRPTGTPLAQHMARDAATAADP